MHDDLHQLDMEIAEALRGLSAVQSQATPPYHPEKWSIQQIVEHLDQTYRLSLPAIQMRIDKGAPTRGTPSLKQYIGQVFVIKLGQFPRGRKAPAAVSPAVPSVPLDGARLQGRVHESLEQLDALATEAERLFGRVRAASHVVLGPLSMGQWRRFHLIHGRHHLKQIHKIRAERLSL